MQLGNDGDMASVFKFTAFIQIRSAPATGARGEPLGNACNAGCCH